MHLLTLPWKLMFALVPPPGLMGGWACFVVALCAIGFQVILISDFASQMGTATYGAGVRACIRVTGRQSPVARGCCMGCPPGRA